MSIVVHRDTLEVHVGDGILGRFRAEPNGPWVHDPDVSAVLGTPPDIASPLVPREHWRWSGDALVSMTQAEKDALSVAGFESRRAARIDAVDTRTRELIAAGYAYDIGDGQGPLVFSLSMPAQSRLEGTYQLRNNLAFAWPLLWPTLDNKTSISFPDALVFEVFHLTAAGALRVAVASGYPLRDALNAAATDAALDAVVDGR